MSNLSVTTGLVSGLDIAGLVDALSLNQQQAINRIEARVQEFEVKKSAIAALEANLLTLSTSVSSLKEDVTFEQQKVTNNGTDQFTVSVKKNAVAGNYSFQSVQQSAAHQELSRGFADTDEQTIGEGTISITQGGFLDEPTLLESLNNGSGIRRGTIRITDRSGSSADIDLTNAISVNDVLDAINSNVDIGVEARVVDDKFVLEDQTGSTSSNLVVVDLAGGNAAADLGIEKSVASDSLSGDAVFSLSESFSLSQINDGNGLSLLDGAPDIRITQTDGNEIEVNLSDSKSIQDVLSKINDADDNSGSLVATLENGRIVLTDSSGGGGSLTTEDVNGSKAIGQLGLDATASGGTLTGNRLSGGLNSVLLRNLNGGAGIETLDEISITDRSGQTGTIDLSSAETLTDIIEAINNATDDISSDALFINASINDAGTGIIIRDTSGATASNLVISDLNSGTTAADLNLTIDDAVDSVDSGLLGLQFVNESTSISDYAPDGEAIDIGLFEITDSDGNVGVVNITSAVKTIGDVITRINALDSVSVRAELNETGDGFAIIDEAGGAGTLTIEEFGDTTTAADLRLLRPSFTDGNGDQRISSQFATIIDVEADDTLDDLVNKINDFGVAVTANVFNDGSSFNSSRLSISATTTGRDSRFVIDDGDLDLGFGTITQGQDALLRVGSDPASAFLIASENDQFDEVVQGIDVDITAVGDSIATVNIVRNTENVETLLQTFVSTYNQFVAIGDELTKFDTDTNQRGILQGDTFVQRVTDRVASKLRGRFGNSDETFQSLVQIGIRAGSGGKLELNTERLQEVLRDDPDAVQDFFTRDVTGFGVQIQETLTSLTDIVDGTFKNERDTLDRSIDTSNDRIEELNVLLEAKKARLLNEFVQMENILSSLQTQQSALTALQPLQVNRSN